MFRRKNRNPVHIFRCYDPDRPHVYVYLSPRHMFVHISGPRIWELLEMYGTVEHEMTSAQYDALQNEVI